MGRGRWWALLIGLLLLGACQSATERAAREEARYDAAMAGGDYQTAQRQIQKAIAENDAEARYWIKLGRVSVAIGNYSQAFAAYGQALGLAPDDVETLQALAQIALLSGNLSRAKEYSSTLLVLVPQDVRGRLIQVGIALREKRYADAAPLIDSLEKDGVANDELFVLKAQLLAGTKRFDEAAAALEPRVAASENKAALLRELLAIYQQEGNRGGVEETYKRLATLAPDDPGPVLAYARLRYADGAVAEARRLAQGIEERNAANDDALLAVARFWAANAPAASALAELTRIADKGGPNRKAEIANLMVDMGQAKAAFALLEPLVGGKSVNAGNVAAQVASARALSAMGRKAEARARVDRALTFDETNTLGLKLRAGLALDAGDLDRALADAQLFASVEPDLVDAALLVATIQARRGDHTLAERAFAHASSRFPDSLAVLRANIAYLDSQRRFRDAAAVAGRFALHHATVPEALRLRAQTCAKAGDEACAGEARRALALLSAGPPAPAPATGEGPPS
jgi:tetratricopeptide (TPR) repeat protein